MQAVIRNRKANVGMRCMVGLSLVLMGLSLSGCSNDDSQPNQNQVPPERNDSSGTIDPLSAPDSPESNASPSSSAYRRYGTLLATVMHAVEEGPESAFVSLKTNAEEKLFASWSLRFHATENAKPRISLRAVKPNAGTLEVGGKRRYFLLDRGEAIGVIELEQQAGTWVIVAVKRID